MIELPETIIPEYKNLAQKAYLSLIKIHAAIIESEFDEKYVNPEFLEKYEIIYYKFEKFREKYSNEILDPVQFYTHLKQRLKESYMFAKYLSKHNMDFDEDYENIHQGIALCNLIKFDYQAN